MKLWVKVFRHELRRGIAGIAGMDDRVDLWSVDENGSLAQWQCAVIKNEYGAFIIKGEIPEGMERNLKSMLR